MKHSYLKTQALTALISLLLPMAVLTTITSCSKDDSIVQNPENDNNNGNSGQQIPEIVVTVDANGNADGGHSFTRIDENSFYIDDLKYTSSDGNLAVSGYDPMFFSGAAKPISRLIYNGRTFDVVGIADNAFKNSTVLVSITIGKNIKRIGSSAFDNCTNFKKVIVLDIATWCRILFSNNWSSNPLCIAHHLYSNETTEITNLVIPNSVTSISMSAFSNCTGLTSVTIPNSVTSIGSGAFSGCSGLTSITIPNSVTRISISAFSGCSGLTSITIPNSVTSIDFGAFSGCTGLTSVTIPNSVTNIDGSAFSGCTGLISFTIPNSVTSIDFGTFSGCTGLTSVTIPNSVTSIDGAAFNNCTSLTSVIIPNSVTSIGGSAFSGCTGLTSVTIGNSVTSIGTWAFSDCSGLTSVTIGNSVTSIGYEAFTWCSGLKDVYCHATNPPSVDDSFIRTPIESATLHVPAGSVETYRNKYSWSGFGSIVPI